MLDRFSKALFVVSMIVLSIAFGSLGALFNWFPHSQLAQAVGGVRYIMANCKNDLALEPTRHPEPATPVDRPRLPSPTGRGNDARIGAGRWADA